jgi:outer membrane protein assembly factor BamB
MRIPLALVLPVLFLSSVDAQEAPVDEFLRSVPNAAGVCVVVGLSDPTIPARIAESGTWMVHGLDANAANVKAARAKLDAADRTGQAIVDVWAFPALPYPEDLANLIVVCAPSSATEAELLRVLAPGGAAWQQKDDKWTQLSKPRPAGFDEWTHARHGPDGNMVSQDRKVALPAGIRWIGGPAQDPYGQRWYYDHVLLSSNGRNIYVFDNSILARDAYNGVPLWSKPFKPHLFQEKGLPVPALPALKDVKQGGRTSKVRPVLVGDQLIVATTGKLQALDAKTGNVTGEFGETKDPRELLVDGGKLFVSDANAIRAWELATRKPLWSAELKARRMVADAGRIVALAETELVAFDQANGREQWRKPEAEAALILTCSAHNGFVVLEKATLRDDPTGAGIKVYAGRDGKLLWTREYPVDMTHFREARAFFAQKLIWIQGDANKLLGLDPATGEEKKKWPTRGKHCSTPVASERFFMTAECEFTDFASGKAERARMFKSACRLPFIPANGLLYTFPVQCECYPMLRGYMGLTAQKIPETPNAPKRQDGEAAPKSISSAKPEEEWPTYRHDVWRSGATPVALRRQDLKVTWSVSVAPPAVVPLATEWKADPFARGPLTPLTAAEGRIFVAVPDRNRVVALDAKEGSIRWMFTAGGRVDGPPTVADGLCLFGAHDGWVYAVSAASGELCWRIRLAPVEARFPAYGQMESPWPVVSSILVDRDTAYAAAGRHPMTEGGVHVVAFKPRTGEIVREWTIDKLEGVKAWYSGFLPNTKTKIGLDFEPVDLLVRDGEKVAMSRWQFDPVSGESKLDLASVTYQAPGNLKVPRGLWGYGIRQTKQVQLKPPAVFGDALKTGVKGDVALLLAGGVLVSVNDKGEVRIGDRVALKLEDPPMPDGLIAAYGALFAVTQQGSVVRFE